MPTTIFMDRSLREGNVAVSDPPASLGERVTNTLDDGAEDLHKGPDRGNRDGTGTDEPHVRGEDLADHALQLIDTLHLPPGADGQHDAVGDDQPQDHGNTDGDADQMPHADEGHGQRRAEHGGARADLEDAGDLHPNGLERRQEGQSRGGQRAPQNHPETLLGLLGPLGGVADAKHLGPCHSLGIRQVGMGDQGPSQRNGIGDPEDAAKNDDENRRPVGKTRPPADDDESRQDEDDRRQGAGCRSDRLNDVVLLDRVIGETPQDCHGDDRGRDGGGEGDPHLESQIDVRRREDDGDDAADNYAANRQFLDGAGCG